MSKSLLALLFIVLLYSCVSPNYDNEQIKQCFNKYKAAILNKDGTKGVECVDSMTLNFYSATLYKIINFDSVPIANEPTINKYTILKVRQIFTEDSIMQMDGKSLLRILMDKGFAGNNNIDKYELGNIEIDNDSAIVEKIIEGRKSPFTFRFNKEKSNWKLSVFSAREHDTYNRGIQQAILKSKLSEDNFILNYIENNSGSMLKKNIWHPIK